MCVLFYLYVILQDRVLNMCVYKETSQVNVYYEEIRHQYGKE